MKNCKGNALLTFIIVIFVMILIGGIGYLAYQFVKMYQEPLQIVGTNQVENSLQENEENFVRNQTVNEEELIPIINPNIDDETQESRPAISASFYYNQLDNYGKIIYDKLKDNKDKLITGTYVFDFKTQFNTLLHSENGKQILNEAFQSAWNAFSYDEMDLFYIDINKMTLINESRSLGGIVTYYISIGPGDYANYLQDDFQTKESIEKANKYIDNIVKQIKEQTKQDTDFKKAKRIHDWLISSLEYNNSKNKPNQYNIYGALHDKKVVCEGYARTYRYLMESVGVPCVLISGTAQNSEGKIESHAWNYIQLKNVWYAVDVTWDDPVITGNGTLRNERKYKYFLKGSEEFFEDHEEDGVISENSQKFKFPVISTTNYENQ